MFGFDPLLSFLCLAVFVVVVAGGIWLLIVAIQRRDKAAPLPLRRPMRKSEPCNRCGYLFSPDARLCPQCGLDPRSPPAVELRNLEVTARQIQAFAENEVLDQATCERIYRCIEARQSELLKHEEEPIPVVLPVPSARRAAAPTDAGPQRRQLEQLLLSCQDVRNLTFGNRKQALAWYRVLPESELAHLAAPALVALARLLRMAALSTRALDVYRLLLQTHAHAPVAAAGALEAAQFAATEQRTELVRWFVGQALKMQLAPEARREAEEILKTLPAEPAVATAAPALKAAPERASAPRPMAPAPSAPPAQLPAAVAALPEPPRPPRRTFGEVLVAFMEERNILWGELVGGMLIVGCSIALVISLWQTLEQIYFFPFLIFATITAAVFGAGLYTLSHWKLESTSRGLLVIGTLLVPLNFLILAGLTDKTGGTLELALGGAALGAFAWLLARAARILVGPPLLPKESRSHWLLTLAILGNCVVQLALPRVFALEVPADFWIDVLTYAPAVCFLLGTGLVLVRFVHRELDAGTAGGLLALLGLAAFAVAVTFGFLLHQSPAGADVLHRLALPLALTAIPIVVGGALVYRRLDDTVPLATAPLPDEPASSSTADLAPQRLSLGTAQLIATLVALGGMVVLLGSLILAWPLPETLVAVCAANVLVLAAVALGFRLPIAHAPALVCLAVGYLTAYHLVGGQLEVARSELPLKLLQLAVSVMSGTALISLVATLVILGEWLARRELLVDSRYYLIGGGLLALLSMALVSRHDQAHPEAGTLTFGTYGALGLLVNLRWRQRWLGYVACAVLLVSSLCAWYWLAPDLSWPRLLLLALLSHATLLLGLWSMLRAMARSETAVSTQEPLLHGALITSTVALVPLGLAVHWSWLGPGTVCAIWLAGTWFALSCLLRSRLLLAGVQSTLTLAVLLGVTLWLQGHEWFQETAAQLWEPRCLQACGVGLGLLGLAWVAVRLFFRVWQTKSAFLKDGWPVVDRAVLSLVVLAQLALAVWGVLPGVVSELTPRTFEPILQTNPALVAQVFSGGAWLVWAVLAVVLIATLWERGTSGAIIGLAYLAITAAVLLAGSWNEERAVASALRWSLAGGLLLCSALLWLRRFLVQMAPRLAVNLEVGLALPRWIRVLLATLCVGPIVVVTAIVAVQGFSHILPVGALRGTFLGDIGWVLSYTVPLAVVFLAFTGHGIRENSAGYAFAAGVVLLITLAGGYLLGVITGGGILDSSAWARSVQLGTIGASLWLLFWLGGRRLLRAWIPPTLLSPANEGRVGWGWPHSQPSWSKFLHVQAGICLAGLCILVLGALGGLTLPSGPLEPDLFLVHYPSTPVWTSETGSAFGWLALALVVSATAMLHRQRRLLLTSEFFCLVGLGAFALLACSVERYESGWGYRTLMLGWTACTLLGSLLTGKARSAERGALGASRSALRLSLSGLTGFVVILLALGAAVAYHDPHWSAAAVLLTGVAFAILAVRQRQESWLFLGGLCCQLGVTLLVWSAYRGQPFVEWWILLVQLLIISGAMVSLGWLWLRPQIYGDTDFQWTTSPLLAMQIAAGVVADGVLLVTALVPMLQQPGAAMPSVVHDAGHALGWIALALSLAALARYVGLADPHQEVHVIGVGGILLGILAASTVNRWDASGTWLSHHVLTFVWSVLGMVLLAASWTGSACRQVGPIFWSDERRTRAARLLAMWFPVSASRRWVEILSVLVAALALRGAWADPFRPYWSSVATFGASALFGLLALWARQQLYVYASGLLIQLVGFLVWHAWYVQPRDHPLVMLTSEQLFTTCVTLQIVCLALASGLWSLLESGLRSRVPPVELDGNLVPYRQLAVLLGLHLLLLLVLTGIVSDLTAMEFSVRAPLTWWALVATAAAIALTLWDPEDAQWAMPLPLLFLAGLIAIGLGLHSCWLEPVSLGWWATALLSAYLVFVAASLRVSTQLRSLASWLHLPPRREGWPMAWCLPVQAPVALLALGLAVWTSLEFGTIHERLAGPVAVLALTVAVLLQVGSWPGLARSLPASFSYGRVPRYLTLGLAGLVVVTLCVAVIPPSFPAPWLHRSALLFVTIMMLGAVYTAALPRLLPADTLWPIPARRTGGLLFVLSAVLLAVVLVQEFVQYDPHPEVRQTPMVLPVVLLVAAALAAAVVSGIVMAVAPRWDPLAWPEQKRTRYVYLAELLLVLLLLHVRLNRPDVFPPLLGQVWPFTLMALAFLGVGLAELCRRKGLHMLAEPLGRTGIFLPLLPVVAFLLRPLTEEARDAAGKLVSGLQPLNRYIERLPHDVMQHALVWFLLGMLYTFVAVTKRSSRFAILAALAANFGLWVIFANHTPLHFVSHPQVWLIPLGLIILVAEHVNRERLEPYQSRALRYAGLLLIYLSSTADMFIEGLGNSVVLPIVLALLAVAGVLLGISLRVRAFLFLGVTFLFLVIFAQIWHAAVDRAHTWVWWVCGIILGAAILTLFALFEKRRNDVLRMIEEIKRWR